MFRRKISLPPRGFIGDSEYCETLYSEKMNQNEDTHENSNYPNNFEYLFARRLFQKSEVGITGIKK